MRMGKRRRRPPVPRNSRGGSPSSRRPTVSQARPMVADRGVGPVGNAAAGRARLPALAPSRGAWCAGGGLTRRHWRQLMARRGGLGHRSSGHTARRTGRGGLPKQQSQWRNGRLVQRRGRRSLSPPRGLRCRSPSWRRLHCHRRVSTAALPFIDFRTFWNGSVNCVPTKIRFYVEHFLFRFCALAVATHLVERNNLTTFYSVRIRIHGLRKKCVPGFTGEVF